MSRSTINRRIASLEESVGAVLLERATDGVTPTSAGEALFDVAERVEGDVMAAERTLSGQDFQLSGRLHVSVFDVGGLVLAPAFERLRRTHPAIELVLGSSDRMLSLHRRETDLAIRATVEPPSPDLFGRRLGKLEYAVYGRRRVVADVNPPWVLWDESVKATGTWRLARELGKPLRVAALVDRAPLMLEMVAAGVGLGLLPVRLARQRRELVPLGCVPRAEQSLDIWALTHPDLKRAARVRAAMSLLGEHAAECLG